MVVKDKEIFSFAGIYSEWIDNKETCQTFSIITTDANELMSQIHNTKRRMPLIIAKEMENTWLNVDMNEKIIAEFISESENRNLEAIRKL